MGEKQEISGGTCIAIAALIFVFILLLGATLWCNIDSFENFTDLVKVSNDNIKHKMMGGKYYHALSPNEDITSKLKDPSLIAVLADWCGHCRRLKDSGTLAEVSKKIPVITISDQHGQAQQLMQSAKSSGFPTLIVFKSGDMKLYKGDRSARDILSNF